MKRVIVVTGPQGSGKSTQAERVAEKYGMTLFEAGVELRKFADGPSEDAREVDLAMTSGELVPHHYVDRLFINYVNDHPSAAGVVTDGFPRSFEQWPILDGVAKKLGAQIIGVHITLSEDEAVNRIKNRVERHGSKVEKRDDDNPEAIKRRLQIYHQETTPVLEFIKKNHRLIEIDGAPSIEKVTSSILTALETIIDDR